MRQHCFKLDGQSRAAFILLRPMQFLREAGQSEPPLCARVNPENTALLPLPLLLLLLLYYCCCYCCYYYYCYYYYCYYYCSTVLLYQVCSRVKIPTTKQDKNTARDSKHYHFNTAQSMAHRLPVSGRCAQPLRP